MTVRSSSGMAATATPDGLAQPHGGERVLGADRRAGPGDDRSVRRQPLERLRGVLVGAGRRAQIDEVRTAPGRPKTVDRPVPCDRMQPRAEGSCRGSKVSARFHRMRNVSCTTSSAVPRSDVSRYAAAKIAAVAVIKGLERGLRPCRHPEDDHGVIGRLPRPSVMRYVPARPSVFLREGDSLPRSAGVGLSRTVPCQPARRRDPIERPGRLVRLETGHAVRPDDGVMRGPGRELEAIAGGQVHRHVRRGGSGRPKRIEPRSTTMTLS